MGLNYLLADVVFPVSTGPVKQGILVLEDDGRIKEVISPFEKQEVYSTILRREDVKKITGALVPGFINSHCHLELSHLKGKIERGTGLPGFLRSVTSQRKIEQELIEQAMIEADREMEEEGIVAVGDISNTSDSIAVKRRSRIKYHTFLEVFDLHPDFAEERFYRARALATDFVSAGQSISIVPHATYTVSNRLHHLIKEHSHENPALYSIHNQETPDEDLFFQEGKGDLAEFLLSTGKYDDWKPSGQTALRTVLSQLPVRGNLLLVHNTFSSLADILFALHTRKSIWWCLCPAANDYIESAGPPVPHLMQTAANLVLGTDSLASNQHLSVLQEMKIIQQTNPGLTFTEILKWVTLNPSHYFGWQDQMGSFETGKRPGVIQLVDESSGVFEKMDAISIHTRLF